MSYCVNIIGAGRTGKTLGSLLSKHKAANIQAICNRSSASGATAIAFIGEGAYCPTIQALPSADITFITTPDEQIAPICEQLSHNPHLRPGSLVLHCSGVLDSGVLLPLKEKGSYIASVHPLRSFACPTISQEEYAGTYCAIEGDSEALPVIHALFQAIGSICYTIDPGKKALYHAAGVFASNYLVTLSEQALLCMQTAGVDRQTARNALHRLMQSTLNNLKKTDSAQQALTGPLQRADYATVQKHLEALENTPQKNLYAVLGKATLDLTEHDKTLKKNLETLLAG